MYQWVILAYLALASAVYLIRLALTQEAEESISEDTEFRLQQLEIKAEELTKQHTVNTSNQLALETKMSNLKTSFELQKGASRGR